MSHPREPRKYLKVGSRRIDRRSFLKNSGFAAASLPLASSLLAACGSSEPGASQPTSPLGQLPRPGHGVTLEGPVEAIKDGLSPEAGPLKIYNWAEYLNPRALNIFEERYGVKVELTTFTNMAEAMSTLTSTLTDFDIFFPTIDQLGKLAINGLLQPLNPSYLPNRSYIWDSLSGALPDAPFYDQGGRYTVPYTVYSTGIGWRTDQPSGYEHPGPSADDVTGLDNPWDIMWDETYKEQVHILDDYRETIALVLMRNGITDINCDDPETRTANLEVARKGLLELRDVMDVKADITEYSDLPEGASLIHQMWSGDSVSLKYYLPKNVEFVDQFRYWTPPEVGILGNDTMTILAGSKNPVLAHAFLNEFMNMDPGTTKDPGLGLVNYSWVGYQPPIKDLDIKEFIIGAGPWQPGRIVAKSLSNSLITEEYFNAGLQELELTPEVDQQFQDVWESFQG